MVPASHAQATTYSGGLRLWRPQATHKPPRIMEVRGYGAHKPPLTVEVRGYPARKPCANHRAQRRSAVKVPRSHAQTPTSSGGPRLRCPEAMHKHPRLVEVRGYGAHKPSTDPRAQRRSAVMVPTNPHVLWRSAVMAPTSHPQTPEYSGGRWLWRPQAMQKPPRIVEVRGYSAHKPPRIAEVRGSGAQMRGAGNHLKIGSLTHF